MQRSKINPQVLGARVRPTTEDFLALESAKLLVGSLQERRSERQTAVLAVLAACAYIAVAVTAYASSEKERRGDLGRASQVLNLRRKALEKAKVAEKGCFGAHAQLDLRVDNLEEAARLKERDVQIGDKARAQKQAETAAAELQAAKSQSREASTFAQLKKAELAAQSELARAKDAIARFEAEYREKRPPEWDRRPPPVPPALLEAARLAADKLSRQTKLVENQDRTGSRNLEGSAAKPDPVPPVRLDLEQRDLEGQAAQARLERAVAEGSWREAQRELDAASLAHVAARSDFERKDRDPAAIGLPILDLSVGSAVFFVAAPCLLVALLLHVVGRHQQVRATATALRAHANAYWGAEHSHGAPQVHLRALENCVPGLEWRGRSPRAKRPPCTNEC